MRDIICGMKRAFTPKQREYLEGRGESGAGVRFRDWHEWIDNLQLATGGDCPWLKSETTAMLREALHRIADLTHRVGGRAVRIGARVIEFIFEQICRYPNTLVVAVVMAAICFLVSSIPLMGWLLGPIVNAVGLGIVCVVFFGEIARNLKEELICIR